MTRPTGPQLLCHCRSLAGALAALVLAGAIAALAVPDALSQTTIAGDARVIDGDTLAIGGTRIRLAGIDAPELGQLCGPVHCGLAAKRHLSEIIGADTVTCVASGLDRYGRTLARCSTSRVRDLGEMMTATGYAMAYRRYSTAYVDAEDAAKAEHLGLWRWSFGNPEDWRRGKR